MKTALSSLSPRYAIALSFFGFTVVGLNSGSNGVLLPSLGNFYHVGPATLGLLFLVISLGYFLSALSSGLLQERFGLRSLLLLGAATFLLGQLGFAFQLPFFVLLVARLLAGFGVGLVETGFNVYITSLPRKAVLLNNLHAFFGVGALIGPVLASAMLVWGWNSVYYLVAALVLPLLLGISVLLNASSAQPTARENEQTANSNVFSATLRIPMIWFAALFLLVYVGIEMSVGSWGYSYLLEVRQQGPLVSGWIVSGFWLGLTVGRFLLQALAERLGYGIGELMYACAVALLAGLLLVWLVPSGIVAAFGFCFIGFSLAPIYPLTLIISSQLVPERLAPNTLGFMVSISIIGLALFPWLAGVFAQIVGIWTLLPYTLLLGIVQLILWIYLDRYMSKRDQRSIQHNSDLAV